MLQKLIVALFIVSHVTWCLAVVTPVYARNPAQLPSIGANDPALTDAQLRAVEALTRATFEFGETARNQLDRSAFDTDALLDELALDERLIADFVTRQIAFEPYVGVLRGADGTLLARAGNAFDQSLLLATVLRNAGYDVVIRAGRLSDADAERLLGQVRHRPDLPSALTGAATESLEAFLEETVPIASQLPPLDETPRLPKSVVLQRIERDRQDLTAALRRAGVRLGADESRQQLLNEVARYQWVDFRLGPSSPWQSVHPAFGGNAAPAVAVEETYSGQVPESLTHRVRLELHAVQRKGETRAEQRLMAPLEFPSARMNGKELAITLFPDALMRNEAAANEGSPAADSRFLIPLLNGELPPGARVLALNGTTVPPDALSFSAAGVFESISNDYESAASALGGLGSEDEGRILLAIDSVRLRATLLHPAQEEKVIERILYLEDVRFASGGEPAQARQRLVSSLAHHHVIGFVNGALVEGYALDRHLAQLNQMAPLLEAWAKPETAACESLACLPKVEVDATPTGSAVARAATFFDANLPEDSGRVLYRDAPNMLRWSAPLLPEHTDTRGVFDIMHNARRALRIDEDLVHPAPEEVLLAGVAETHFEHVLHRQAEWGTILDRFDQEDVPELKAVTKPSGNLTDLEREMVRGALEAGYVAVAPLITESMPGLSFAWWQVDPATGQTLGMTRLGGATLVERVVKWAVFLGIAIVIIYAALIDVQNPDEPRQRATFLSKLWCSAQAALVGATTFDMTAAADEGLWCIGNNDGWEYP